MPYQKFGYDFRSDTCGVAKKKANARCWHPVSSPDGCHGAALHSLLLTRAGRKGYRICIRMQAARYRRPCIGRTEARAGEGNGNDNDALRGGDRDCRA